MVEKRVEESAAPPKPRTESYWIIEWRFPSHAGKQFDWQPIGNPPFITESDAKKYPMRGYYEYRISEFAREGELMPHPKPRNKYKRTQTPAADQFTFACNKFLQILERIDNRCMAADGCVTPTLREASDTELRVLYLLAKKIAQFGPKLRLREG